jgi:anti-anti-sigma factor
VRLTFDDQDTRTVITLRGDLSADQATRLRREAVERMHGPVRDFVIDMQGLEFIDSKGLEALIWLQDQCVQRLGQLRLACCSDNVNQVLRITRLNKRFEADASVDESIRRLGEGV